MKKLQWKYIRWTILVLLLMSIFLFRFISGTGEFYARSIYPVISSCLSRIASWFPFSLCEVLVIVTLVCLLVYPFIARRRNRRWRWIAVTEVEILLWMYVWFYWGWGINYFCNDFFERAGVTPCTYEEQRFKQFLSAYTDSLNAAFSQEVYVSQPALEQVIKSVYAKIPEKYGLIRPKDFQHPKRSFCNALYSGVGVLGYMGPFFDESHVNHELLPVQRPFTYAHELAHLLGVSSEAEANFWAYQVCIHSTDAGIRYSGYFGLLPYVVVNTRGLLSETEFKSWLDTIRPEIIKQLYDKEAYWDDRYNKLLGKLQNVVYNWYLKSNQIPSGQKNYAQVIGMILSLPTNWWK